MTESKDHTHAANLDALFDGLPADIDLLRTVLLNLKIAFEKKLAEAIAGSVNQRITTIDKQGDRECSRRERQQVVTLVEDICEAFDLAVIEPVSSKPAVLIADEGVGPRDVGDRYAFVIRTGNNGVARSSLCKELPALSFIPSSMDFKLWADQCRSRSLNRGR